MEKDIRWQQRFNNFNKALERLEKASLRFKSETLSELEIEGLIQRFEYTYELGWKTLQDLLKNKGFENFNGPGAVLTQAFKLGLIDNAEAWRRLKKSRELTSHTYDQETADAIAQSVTSEYLDLFLSLQQNLGVEKSRDEENLF